MSDGYLAWHMQELVRVDMQRYWQGDDFELEASDDGDIPNEEASKTLAENALRGLRVATPYTWNAAMGRLLVERAHAEPPAATAIVDALPSEVGFAWFETPLFGVHGWVWCPITVRGNPRCELMCFTRDRSKNGTACWAPREVTVFGSHWVWEPAPEGIFDLSRYFAASIVLLSERITYITREVPRAMLSRKQLKQAREEERRPIVRVVELRTITRVSEEPSQPAESEREFHYQWMVREHTRRLRRRDTGEVFTVKVRAHRKGPDGAPWLRPQATVFHVDR